MLLDSALGSRRRPLQTTTAAPGKAVKHPETFDRTYWVLLVTTVPIVLPCTLLGVNLYKSLSDVNFRRITFMLLGTSGLGLLIKAAGAITLFAAAATAAAR